MLTEAWKGLVEKYIVHDVPDVMAACFDCNVVQCFGERYASCPNRLALAAALKARASVLSAAKSEAADH
ncbi:MAG: hypothetical protein WB509_20895 [Acetobacteraceae bacterium]|jgi:hypothetical protein